eukprot:754385-Hanusia_phi.AAC.2
MLDAASSGRPGASTVPTLPPMVDIATTQRIHSNHPTLLFSSLHYDPTLSYAILVDFPSREQVTTSTHPHDHPTILLNRHSAPPPRARCESNSRT